MKKTLMSLFVFLALVSLSTFSFASDLLLDLFLAQYKTSNVIDWKVGDYAKYTLDLGFLGKGEVRKEVTKEENISSIWITTTAKTPMGNQKIEALISKTNGKILKLIVDGKEQPYKEHTLELISKEASEITVPAGTFKAIYIKVKDKTDEADIETWINPKDIPLDGTAKTILKKYFLTTTLELTEFHKKPDLKTSQILDHEFMNLAIRSNDFLIINSGTGSIIPTDFSTGFLHE